MVRVFISQPMAGKTAEEIQATRERAIQKLENRFAGKLSVVNPVMQLTEDPLAALGKALMLMSTAEVAYFVPGWENARGCKIENTCAIEYGITVIEGADEESEE